jgi:hypothetical protein
MRKRDKIHGFFVGGRNFKKEFKIQVRFLINITLGFTIAFTWRQTIFDAIQTLVQKLSHTQGLPSSILTSTVTTILAIAIILISSHFLRDNQDS